MNVYIQQIKNNSVINTELTWLSNTDNGEYMVDQDTWKTYNGAYIACKLA